MNFEHLQISEPATGILQITLNRPRQFNALGKLTFQELHAVLDEETNHQILMITGAGRAFCFGADFQEFKEQAQLPELLKQFQSLISKLYFHPKITVAAINGFATGAGLDLALACDFRLASETAKLGEAYISMGLVPDGGGSFFLPNLIGISRSLELLAFGNSISASEAHGFGLVHRIFPGAELPQKSLEFCNELLSKPKTALRLIKQLVKKNAGLDLTAALANENEAQQTCFQDPEHKAIVAEFLARRIK